MLLLSTADISLVLAVVYYDESMSVAELLDKLRERLRGSVESNQLSDYSIDWSDDRGVNSDSHKQYLDKFCDDFEEKVKRLIDDASQMQEKTNLVSGREILRRHSLDFGWRGDKSMMALGWQICDHGFDPISAGQRSTH